MDLWTQIKKQLKLLFSNRVTILVGIAVPVILTYLFSGSITASKKPALYIADLNRSSYSIQLVKMLKSHNEITVIMTDKEDILKKVDSQIIPMGLIIQKDFDNKLLNNKTISAEIIKDFDTTDSAILKQVINTEMGILQKVAADSSSLPMELKASANDFSDKVFENLQNTTSTTIDSASSDILSLKQETTTQTLLGFLVMFIWFVIIQGFRTLIEERENNTYFRLLSTPVSYNRYLTAKVCAAYLFGGFHILAVLLAGKYLLKLPSFHNLTFAILVFAVYLLLLSGISLPLAMLMKRHEDFTITFAVIIIATGILGGSFFPLTTAPPYLVLLSKFTPEAWGLALLKASLFHNGNISSMIIPLTVITGIAFLGIGIAFLMSSRTRQRAD